MKRVAACPLVIALGVVVLALSWQNSQAAPPPKLIECDLVIYGGTSGGVAAALQAARMGKYTILLEPGRHLGGMSSGGLSYTDMGDPRAVGGIAREFYRRVGAKYGKPEETHLEPHVAENVFGEMIGEAKTEVYYDKRIKGVKKNGARIVEIGMDDGTAYRAKMFIDATYEGDLLAKAGVTYTLLREGNAKYGETLNGVQLFPRFLPELHWGVPGANGRREDNKGIWDRDIPFDPYVTKGDPKSGLLPLVQPGEIGCIGGPAPGIMSYCYRLIMTANPANRIPLTEPAGYDPKQYELVARFAEACVAAGDDVDLRWFSQHSFLINDKVDFNSATFGTNLAGGSIDWPEASWQERAKIAKRHELHARGLFYFISTDPRIPAKARNEMKRYGLCKDEFPETQGWPHQLYVREARRMVSDFVMTEHHLGSREIAPNSIALGSYGIDIHEIRRLAYLGFVIREGKVGVPKMGVPHPYPIAYGAIVPKKSECDNLLVSFALSASHVGFASIRMEPVFMELSQAAATAACQAIDAKVAVQDVDYAKLRARLLADKQILDWELGKK